MRKPRKKKKVPYYLSTEQEISRLLSHVQKACIYYPKNTHTRYVKIRLFVQSIDYGFQ